jgi:hypothetical protein
VLDEAEATFRTSPTSQPVASTAKPVSDVAPDVAGAAAEAEAEAKPAATGAVADTSLAQANVLRFLTPLVVELGWRGLPLIRRLFRGELMRSWATHACVGSLRVAWRSRQSRPFTRPL